MPTQAVAAHLRAQQMVLRVGAGRPTLGRPGGDRHGTNPGAALDALLGRVVPAATVAYVIPFFSVLSYFLLPSHHPNFTLLDRSLFSLSPPLSLSLLSLSPSLALSSLSLPLSRSLFSLSLSQGRGVRGAADVAGRRAARGGRRQRPAAGRGRSAGTCTM
jgi:hypothetical protein